MTGSMKTLESFVQTRPLMKFTMNSFLRQLKQSIKGLKNYKQVKVQWTEQLVAKQQKVTEEIKRDRTASASADAERQKEVLEIKIKERKIETEGQKNISEINNQIIKDKENNLADIAKYAKDKEPGK